MPKGARKIDFSFEESHISHFGGMWLIHRFCQRIGLRRLLQRYVSVPDRRSEYGHSQMFVSLIYVIIMGLRRINKTEILQYNGAFKEMLGLERFPDQTTIRRFLKRLPPKTIRQLVRLHDSLRAQLFSLPRKRTTLIFDLDSVVLVVYGKPEMARIGYNPKKPGRRSYHPLFCFESHLQEFWHGTLRPGNAAAATGAIGFLNRCLKKVPKDIPRSRIRFRMDAGFYGSRILRFLEGKGCGYVIVAKQHPHIKARAQGCRFKVLKSGFEVGEFWHTVRHDWKKPHRFIVVRRPIPDDPVEAKQLTLFKDTRYVYHVFVTNLEFSPWRLYLFYNPRAATEKNNREFLYEYPLAKIPTNSWTANVAFFQILLFAADIVHWFKRLCLPPEYLRTTVETIRTDFLVLPARFVREHHRNIIKLPHDYHHQDDFQAADTAVRNLRVPEKFRFCK